MWGMPTHVLAALVAAAVLLGCDGDGAEAPATDRSEGSETRPAEGPRTEATPETGTAPSTSAVLVDLRERLEQARSSDADEPVSTGPASVEGLVGTHRGVIENALGEPQECEMGTQTVCPGGGGPCVEEERATPAPCEQADDVFYSFYHLPEGWVGGGPELLLRYDDAGRCTHGVWRFTQ